MKTFEQIWEDEVVEIHVINVLADREIVVDGEKWSYTSFGDWRGGESGRSHHWRMYYVVEWDRFVWDDAEGEDTYNKLQISQGDELYLRGLIKDDNPQLMYYVADLWNYPRIYDDAGELEVEVKSHIEF